MLRTRTRAAVVREVSDSFHTGALRDHNSQSLSALAIDQKAAIEEHHVYFDELAKAFENENCIYIVPQNSRQPDCMFIEDTSVVVSGKLVVLTTSAMSTRSNELVDGAIENVYRNVLGMEVLHMSALDPRATCDGGDVLCTDGGDVFVGISSRTNKAAFQVLSDVFQQHYRNRMKKKRADSEQQELPIKVHAISVPVGLHLKCLMTSLGGSSLVIVDSPDGNKLEAAIKEEAQTRADYHFVRVDDWDMANVVRVNHALLVPKGYPASKKIVQDHLQSINDEVTVIEVENVEGSKADGSLTCRSVLIPAE